MSCAIIIIESPKVSTVPLWNIRTCPQLPDRSKFELAVYKTLFEFPCNSLSVNCDVKRLFLLSQFSLRTSLSVIGL